MIHIILKNRKAIRYNAAVNVSIKDGVCTVLDAAGGWIANIPVDNIERVEAVRPCAVMREAAAPKNPKYLT